MKYAHLLTDRDIDRQIVNILYGTDDKDINRIWNRGGFAYCNNWSDMGSLIVKHNISIAWNWAVKDMYSAYGTQWVKRPSPPDYPVNHESSNENRCRPWPLCHTACCIWSL